MLIPIRTDKKEVFTSRDVTSARNHTGLSQKAFGRLCGWSQTHQSKRFEAPGARLDIKKYGKALETMNIVLGNIERMKRR